MKITNFLYDEDHAQRYITECIIKLNGKLIYTSSISKVKNTFRVSYRSLPFNDEGMKFFYLDKEEVEWCPSKLGFVNTKNNSRDHFYTPFVFRTHARIWKLGLTRKNMYFDNETCGNAQRATFLDSLYDRLFIDSLQGKYPTLQFAKLHKNCALSRNFAINCHGYLFYAFNRNKPIGRLDHPDDTFILDEKFYYLMELANEDGIKCKF